MQERNINQTALAEKAGFKNQSNIAMLLKGNMRTDKLLTVLEALDCELIIKDKLTGETRKITE